MSNKEHESKYLIVYIATPAEKDKEPPVKKPKVVYGGEMEVDWAYGSGWQGTPSGTGEGREREREGRDMEGLLMDTKSGIPAPPYLPFFKFLNFNLYLPSLILFFLADINRWISGGSRPFVYSAAPDTIPISLRSYSAFVEAYGNELGLVLHFQRVPQPRASSSASTSVASAASSANLPSTSSETSPSSAIVPVTPSENTLVALSTTALSDPPSSSDSSTTAPAPPSCSPPPSPPPPPPVHSGTTWVFVRALEQRWDVKTWAEVPLLFIFLAFYYYIHFYFYLKKIISAINV